MRSIQVSTDVFAKIWSLRVAGERDENAILERVLDCTPLEVSPQIAEPVVGDNREAVEFLDGMIEKVTWVDDVKSALKELGGRARLNNIYRIVETIRRNKGRSIPRTLPETVRRTLEDNSSDSRNYRGVRDVFYMPEGKGAGIWALR